MPEGYLAPTEKQQPQQKPQNSPQPESGPVREIESKLTINAMKVMYSDAVWPDIEAMIGKGETGIIQAIVMISINILDLAKHKGYQPSDDELLTAAEELGTELIEIAVQMGSVQGDPEQLLGSVLGQAIAEIAQSRPDIVNMEKLKALASTATPEEQAEAEAMFGSQQQTPQPQEQPQQGGGYLNGV